MPLAERRAAGRHGRGDAGQMAGHHIGVALYDHGLPALGDVALGQVGAVEHGALPEDRGLRRVQVLGTVVVGGQLAGAERDHVAAQVPDRPDQPATELVCQAMPSAARESPGEQLVLGEPQAAQVPGGHLPVVGRVADAEPLRGGDVESAGGEEVARRAGSDGQELLRIIIGGRPVRLEQPAALRLLLAGDMAALLVAQLDADPGRQPLHRLGEAESVDLADERDDVTALGAGEAVPQAASRGDVERRRLLLVERAQALHRAAARATQLEVLPDDLGDGRAGTDQLDVLVTDPAWHLRESSPGPHRAALVTSGPGPPFWCSGMPTSRSGAPAAWAGTCTGPPSPTCTAGSCPSWRTEPA